jgi:N-acetylglucosaminyl-diphospho-decaprenol L-rhamnosyltransferase
VREEDSTVVFGSGTVRVMSRYAVDVVVVSYNSRDHLAEAVRDLSAVEDFHVVVVDSASTDGTLTSVDDLPVSTIALTRNRGFGHACNVGFRHGDAPFVLFLNPTADDRIAAAAPRIVDEDGALDYSMRRFPRLRTTFAQAFFLHRVLPRAEWSDELVRDRGAYSSPGSPDWVSGACILVKRSVLDRLQGFDEHFFMYCEDIDLCRRIRDLSLEIAFDPEATVVHEGGASMPRSALLPVLASSRIRYAAKHQSRPVALLERAGVATGALTHAIVSRGGLETRQGWLRAFVRALAPGPALKER